MVSASNSHRRWIGFEAGPMRQSASWVTSRDVIGVEQPMFNWPEGALLLQLAMIKVRPQGGLTLATLNRIFVHPQPNLHGMDRGFTTAITVSRTWPACAWGRRGHWDREDNRTRGLVESRGGPKAEDSRSVCRCVDYVCDDSNCSFA
jgi:hypothetical protein